MLVYLIVKRLTNRHGIASASAAVLLGAAVFLTQSTILEEYALATMLLALSFWFYLKEHRYRAALCWGLGTAVHVFILGAVLFWLIVEWRSYLKPLLLITLPIAGVFYAYILLLMYLDTPRLLAGGLNMYSLQQYLTVTGGAIVGQLSLFEAPKRLLLTSRLLLMSFGLALVPLTRALHKPVTKSTAVALGVVVWTLWYQITCLDPLSWTFITYASPFVAILVGVGLSRLSILHLRYVAASALALVIVNCAFLNANVLTNREPWATNYYEALQQLPDNSVVLCMPGAHSLGLYYAMSEGKNLIPLIFPYIGHGEEDWGFDDYRDWLNRTYGLALDDDFDTLTAVTYLKLQGYEVYFASTPTKQSNVRRCLELGDTEWLQIKRVTGLTGLGPEPYISKVPL